MDIDTLQVWDQHAFFQRVSHNHQLAGQLVSLFVTETPAAIKAMHRALSSMDVQGCATLAHKLKGACANLGADALRQICQRLEDHEGETQQAFAWLAELESAYAALSVQLQKQFPDLVSVTEFSQEKSHYG